MAVLVIGENERNRIAEIVAYALAHPLTLEQIEKAGVVNEKTLRLEDRKPGFERPPSQHVVFPGGYRAAFSIEQQPVGLCSHLSVSVEGRPKKGMMPHPAAVEMIAQAFGVPFPADMAWMEEFDPGEYAVNLVSVYTTHPAGHA